MCALSHELSTVARTLAGNSEQHQLLNMLVADVQRLVQHNMLEGHPGTGKHPRDAALQASITTLTTHVQTLHTSLATAAIQPGSQKDPDASVAVALNAMEHRLANLILSTQHPDVPWLYVVVPETRPPSWWERANVFQWGTHACRVHLLCNGRGGIHPHFLFDEENAAAREAQLHPRTGKYRGYPVHLEANATTCALVRYSAVVVRCTAVAMGAVGAKSALGGYGMLAQRIRVVLAQYIRVLGCGRDTACLAFVSLIATS